MVMNYLKNLVMVIALSLGTISTPALGADLKIGTLYWGTEENTYRNETYGLEMNDSQPTNGVYYQMVDPEKYQWNLFIYRTEDINFSDLLGANFIYDHYFGVGEHAKNVIGIGANYLRMDLDGTGIETSMGTLDGFKLDQDILSLYVRLGRSYNYGGDPCRFTVMPWAGGQLDLSRGTGLVDYPGPGSVSFQIDEGNYSWIGGINLKVDYRHFLQAEVKQSITYHDNTCYNKSSAMVNFFFTPKWGLSYRYNHLETATGEDSYNIFGIAATF
jgi:hypothetical protein